MDWLLQNVNALINYCLAGLPDSPFPSIVGSIPTSLLQTLNWFIPVGSIIDVLSAWLLAVGLFYMFRVILAWVKVIGS